ncbi:hypothetical protein [Streptomyces aurantiogriseus]|uniref:Uncharacterized protein n=1 Tax=Streptomyces aurantiogriseus TaxID=66870 RepID=A0A918FHU1_9ACTN|nr:hypothetical protein GCM10010251_63870 [Streptomyces aurantiogriseus]
MNRIEFFHYPWAENPSSLLWGIRVDGRDLRAYAAEATRELWRPELEGQFEDDEAELAETVRNQHDGLGVPDFADRPAHFLTAADSAPLLGCPCGHWGCWPLMASIATTPTTVTWSSFRQPHRKQWGELRIGPFTFDRTAFEAALAAPSVLAEDPWGPAPGR